MSLNLNTRRFASLCIFFAFLANILGPICPFSLAQAQDFRLPAPGVMVALSQTFNPPILKGIKVHPDNPFRFDFILDRGSTVIASAAKVLMPDTRSSSQSQQEQLKLEATKLIKYFLATLTIPEKDLWVNLSPYEKDRIIPQSFGLTEMGRDLLAEDYMLKQITASLIYPEGMTGKKFWKRIYEEAAKRYGTTNIPVNTFNKVWIVPEKAVVYENSKAGTAYVVESRLKVMLEQDYLSLSKNVSLREAQFSAAEGDAAISKRTTSNDVNALGSQIVREIVIPELTKEVNEGKNFSQLRQVYNSLILATWYKKKIKDSILEQVYADKNKIAGVQYTHSVIASPKDEGPHAGHSQELAISKRTTNDVETIYLRYLQAFKKGVYNYIKEDVDPVTQETTPKKYFSGGTSFSDAAMASALSFTTNAADLSPALLGDAQIVDVSLGQATHQEPGRKTLDGLTILRFSHSVELNGGQEIHINSLNNQLLQRNAVKIIQFFYTEDTNLMQSSTRVGKGWLIQIPIFSKPKGKDSERLIKNFVATFIKKQGLDSIKLRKFLASKSVKWVLNYMPVVRKYYQPYSYSSEKSFRETLDDVLNRYSVDLMIDHSPFLFNEGSAIINEGVLHHIPVILQNHGSNRFLASTTHSLAQRAAYIATVTTVDLPESIKDKITVLSNGIDIDFFDPNEVSLEAETKLREQWHIETTDKVVLLPARIEAGKGQLDALRMFLESRKIGENYKLVLVGKSGDDGYLNEIKKRIKMAKLGKDILMTGNLSPQELRTMYKISDLVILPSASEGLSRVLLEAQAMEKPVIGYANDGIKESLLDGKTGYLITNQDLNGFARKIELSLKDKKEGEAMGKRGREFVLSNFTLLGLAERHEQFYLSVLGKNSSRANETAENYYDFSKKEENVRKLEEVLQSVMREISGNVKPIIVGGRRYFGPGRKDIDIVLQGANGYEDILWKNFVVKLAGRFNEVSWIKAKVLREDPFLIDGVVQMEAVKVEFFSRSGERGEILLDIHLDYLSDPLRVKKIKALLELDDQAIMGSPMSNIIKLYFMVEYFIGDRQEYRSMRKQYEEGKSLLLDASIRQRLLVLKGLLSRMKGIEMIHRIHQRLNESVADWNKVGVDQAMNNSDKTVMINKIYAAIKRNYSKIPHPERTGKGTHFQVSIYPGLEIVEKGTNQKATIESIMLAKNRLGGLVANFITVKDGDQEVVIQDSVPSLKNVIEQKIKEKDNIAVERLLEEFFSLNQEIIRRGTINWDPTLENFGVQKDGKVVLIDIGGLSDMLDPDLEENLNSEESEISYFMYRLRIGVPNSIMQGFLLKAEKYSFENGGSIYKQIVEAIKPENHVRNDFQPVDDSKLISKLTKDLGLNQSNEAQLSSDDAMSVEKNGGIDLTPANMNLQVQNNDGEIKFRLDPVMLQQLQNAPGFVPVIINVQPMTNLRKFLGLADIQPV